METHSLIEPNSWVTLRLPNGTNRLLQIIPNMMISLGRYGSFPSNLLIHRPYHLTYELNEKSPSSDTFTRLRVVPAIELHADVLAEEEAAASSSSRPDSAAPEESIISATDGIEYSLVDNETGAVVVRSNREIIDDNARQTLTWQEIEALKRDGTDSGKDLIAKLMLSHTGMDQKTTFSMAKYKLLKEEEVPAQVHGAAAGREQFRELRAWTTGGLLVAALAERMGVLYPKTTEENEANGLLQTHDAVQKPVPAPKKSEAEDSVMANTQEVPQPELAPAVKRDHDGKPKDDDQPKPPDGAEKPKKRPIQRKPDFHIPFATTNTMTLVHTNGQPNLTALNYWGYDSTNPNHPPHPLLNHLLPLSWLQLIEPELDTVYATEPVIKTAEEVASWKANRRGNYHRKRRRWARTRYIADTAHAGDFSGLVVASVMDPISVLRPLLPLVASGAPVAIYSPHVEPLAQLADCFSVARRVAFNAQPDVVGGRTAEELERWEGTDDFPLNPTLLLGVQLHTSRGRRWQVLPGRTHPVMTAKGGAEGYVLTGWKARPAEGKIAARGKFQKKGRSAGIGTAEGTPAAETATATPASVEA
ncbi:hypothetical protein INS49_011518 [Diaporthe citri]|uniref:uncharacterized protein n=1 Tax=Diaporthe citri TaxID=83186 RepID=UPI001C8259FF|nr:uncharacterized protein INS49_011518 [Diaporthe citri]KAG6360456.1 hypothetical protein INS49_011518 [Diaporthe citri]